MVLLKEEIVVLFEIDRLHSLTAFLLSRNKIIPNVTIFAFVCHFISLTYILYSNCNRYELT